MAKRNVYQGQNKRAMIWIIVAVAACLLIGIVFVLPGMRGDTELYRVRVKGEAIQNTTNESSQNQPEHVQKQKLSFDHVVKDSELISKENASVYSGIVTYQANAALEKRADELASYNMLTNWKVPFSSVNRITDLKNMSVDEIKPIKVAVFYNGDLWIVDLEEIAELDSFDSATGRIKLRLPFSVMAYALFEPKRNIG